MRAFFDIDVQIDFVFPAGALYAPGAERVIPPVAALNAFAATHGIPLVSTMCAHPENGDEFRAWPPHCVVGTVGQLKPAATLLPKLAVVPNALATVDIAGAQQILLEKNDLDLFTNPNLPGLLDRIGADEYYVYGVLTEYCVKCAVMGLLKTGSKVHLVTDAIAHLSAPAAEKVVADFTAAGGKCITIADILTR